MFTSNVLNNKSFRRMKRARLWKNVILWAISQREISSLVIIFKKKIINLHGGQLDVTTHIYHKSCAHHPHSDCYTFFHGNLSNPKSSEDTLLYLYVIWNMLKSAALLETILTPVICHKDVRCHDGVTLYFSMKFPFNFRGLRIGNKSAATFKKGISYKRAYPPLSAWLHAKFEGGLKFFISQDVWFLQRLILNRVINIFLTRYPYDLLLVISGIK